MSFTAAVLVKIVFIIMVAHKYNVAPSSSYIPVPDRCAIVIEPTLTCTHI